jgi:blue copper oxidase
MRLLQIKFFILLSIPLAGYGQNPLYIPPALTGTTFNLNIQSGFTTFYPGVSTPTYGVNGVWMAPTIIVNKGDSIKLNVQNGLKTSTTMHWHGMHVSPKNDGGPNIIINSGTTWHPSFNVRNDAGTFWYHPHGINKTDLHVSKGLAGMLIVKDSTEALLTLPRTYGKDDFPIIIQSKAFDVLTQIAIATEMDTALFMNGTLHPYLDAPAQVMRLRLLNASSMRTYFLGFSRNMLFTLIGNDDGLLDSSLTLNRLRLSPGERAEILIDLQGLKGQKIYMKNYGSELPDGIYGAKKVGVGKDTIQDYGMNPLNGADYNILQLNVVQAIAGAITAIPKILVKFTKWDPVTVNSTKTFTINSDSSNQKTEGPFNINRSKFDMDTINVTTYKNSIEIWRWINKTRVAHPIHIHDIHFFILDINGIAPPKFEAGKKDVVLVMPGDTVRLIMKFEDFGDNKLAYMYHCHMLHHEDDGMMGQFLVMDTSSKNGILPDKKDDFSFTAFPNPSTSFWQITGTAQQHPITSRMFNIFNQEIGTPEGKWEGNNFYFNIPNSMLNCGMYFLQISCGDRIKTIRMIKD